MTSTLSPDQFDALETSLGVKFIQRDVVVRSLAHRSWCAENGEAESNERLEFLGDSVLGLVVTHYVFEHFPNLPEGQLSEVRAGVVNARVLAEIATELGLGRHLLLGKGEDAAGGRSKRDSEVRPAGRGESAVHLFPAGSYCSTLRRATRPGPSPPSTTILPLNTNDAAAICERGWLIRLATVRQVLIVGSYRHTSPLKTERSSCPVCPPMA